MLDDLKITLKQKQLLQKVVKSHPYFPELALDDLTFKNNLYTPTDQAISDLIEREILVKKGKSLVLTRFIAKKYWNDILKLIPIEQRQYPITKEFLETKSHEDLLKVYYTLTSLDGKSLTKENLMDEILKKLKGDTMAVGEKAKKTEEIVEDGMLTPKDIASKYDINPTAIRKVIRTMKGIKKTEDGWRITEKQAEEIIKKYENNRKEAAERRSERMKELQAKRKEAANKKKSEE